MTYIKGTEFTVAKELHERWAESKGLIKEAYWHYLWDLLKEHFDGDTHKVVYTLDLLLILHLDEKYGGSHMKEICKYHCMAARDF